MPLIELNSTAKINIGLLIKGKRPDGYHLLETLFYPIDLADEMTIETTGGKGIEIEMEGIEEKVPLEKNLIYKAWEVLNAKFPQVDGIRIKVQKNIPTGAGLGGGSSNAAFCLTGLNSLFELGQSPDDLAPLAAPLGADVPFFLHNRPMLATGIGHDLVPFDIEIKHEIRIVTPEIHSSTVEAYQGLDFSLCDPDRELEPNLKVPVTEWKGRVVNDLEMPVFLKYPELRALKEKMYEDGAVYAAMTGSGAALFGLF